MDNRLTNKELELISMLVKNGANHGILGNVIWRLELKGNYNKLKDQIVNLLNKGITVGDDYSWRLNFERCG